ncbi:MAG: hypothetical protein JWM07_940 [Candidatus Saccharibacteria bacterium]|nr:hypothetical protein [Candidatus Saccharibacteria bacterium]
MAEIDKSKGKNDHPFDPIEHLEMVSKDDYLVEMNTKADSAEQYMNTHELNPRQRSMVIDELNNGWIHMNKSVEAWGMVYAAPETTPSGTIDYATESAQGSILTSSGFKLLPFVADFDGETLVHYKVAYSFVAENMYVGILRDGFAGKFPDSGPAMAIRRFNYYYPNEAATINELAEVTDSRPAATPILNFARYDVQADMHTPEGKEYISDLQTYLTEKMNFDKKLPYIVKCELDESDEEFDLSIVQIIASPIQISLEAIKEQYAVGSLRHIPCVDLMVHDTDSSKPDLFLQVPLSSLIRFDSVRHTYDDK